METAYDLSFLAPLPVDAMLYLSPMYGRLCLASRPPVELSTQWILVFAAAHYCVSSRWTSLVGGWSAFENL